MEHASRKSQKNIHATSVFEGDRKKLSSPVDAISAVSSAACATQINEASYLHGDAKNAKKRATIKKRFFRLRLDLFRSSNHTWRFVKPTAQFKHVVSLTAAYAFCTAPPMLYLVADMALPKMEMNMVLMNVCLLFPFIYCVICPILLIKCLPGVQKSVRQLLLSVCKCSSKELSGRRNSS